ncbi:MAG: hypothetical protein ACR2MX_02870 [Cyclobacteriaceae bacterium]
MQSQGEISGQLDATKEEIQYKVIDGKKHLSFASIRQYVHGRLASKDQELVAAHISRCNRCRSIWKDLAGTNKKKKTPGWYKGAAIISVILITAALAVYFLTYDFGKPSLLSKQLSKAEAPSQVETSNNSETLIDSPILQTDQATETDNQAIEEIPEEVNVEDDPEEQTVAFDPAPVEEPVEEEVSTIDEPVAIPAAAPAVKTRKIYGKITLAGTGETVSGVNVMVNGTNQAKISNAIGGYNIQIPRTATELVFIYRGKKLYKKIDRNTSLVNVQLDLEKMVY